MDEQVNELCVDDDELLELDVGVAVVYGVEELELLEEDVDVVEGVDTEDAEEVAVVDGVEDEAGAVVAVVEEDELLVRTT